MRIGVIAMAGLASLIGSGLIAAEVIDSRVIHNYRFISAGYGYLHDVAEAEIEGHGAVGAISFEEQNFLFGASGGYFWLNEEAADINLWNALGSIGYVVRLMENHINIVPRLSGGLEGLEIDDPFFGDISDESWVIAPGIGLSYAINNQFAFNGGYTYAYNFDVEDEEHLFNVGGKVAILEQVGLAVNAVFSDDDGFRGITGAVEFHF